jgi:hypothetical protein
LETDTADVRIVKAEFDGLPEEREIFWRDSHGKCDREIDLLAALDGPKAGFAKIRPAKSDLAFELRAVELEVDLKMPVLRGDAELLGERVIASNADAVRIQQQIINSGIGLNPYDEFEKLWVQGRFTAGELKNLDAPLPVNDALHAPLDIRERDGVQVIASANG